MGRVELTFETVRRQNLDERLGVEGTFDFEVDRNGEASYTRVTTSVQAPSGSDPIPVFVTALNRVIEHLRNDFDLYWLRELEVDDLSLLNLHNTGSGEAKEALAVGRRRGMTLPTRLNAAAHERLRERLDRQERASQWRLLQLDAQEALDTGRYDQAVVLAWTALESLAKSETPRVARTAKISVKDLVERLTGHPPKPTKAPLSLDQAVNLPHVRVMDLIRVCCELSNVTYDPASLAESARRAYNLRNVVVHRGLRLTRSQAQRVLNAVSFVLGNLQVPRTQAPDDPDMENWLEHFGKITPELRRELESKSVRLVLYRQMEKNPDPLNAFLVFERADNQWIVTIPNGIREEIAAALVLATNDSVVEYENVYYPSLVVTDQARQLQISGWLDSMASSVTQAVYFSHAALRRAREGLDMSEASRYALDMFMREFEKLDHTIADPDIRAITVPARLASYMSMLASPDRRKFARALGKRHKQLAARADAWALVMAQMDPDDVHSMCDVLRIIHGEAGWLDSIRVDCPIEGIAHGSRPHPR